MTYDSHATALQISHVKYGMNEPYGELRRIFYTRRRVFDASHANLGFCGCLIGFGKKPEVTSKIISRTI